MENISASDSTKIENKIVGGADGDVEVVGDEDAEMAGA